jgi:hypothetical protein
LVCIARNTGKDSIKYLTARSGGFVDHTVRAAAELRNDFERSRYRFPVAPPDITRGNILLLELNHCSNTTSEYPNFAFTCGQSPAAPGRFCSTSSINLHRIRFGSTLQVYLYINLVGNLKRSGFNLQTKSKATSTGASVRHKQCESELFYEPVPCPKYAAACVESSAPTCPAIG